MTWVPSIHTGVRITASSVLYRWARAPTTCVSTPSTQSEVEQVHYSAARWSLDGRGLGTGLLRGAGIGALTAIIALSACGSETDRSADEATHGMPERIEDVTSRSGVVAFVGELNAKRVEVANVPRSPAELGRSSELIVEGTVVGVEPGRSMGDESVVEKTVLLTVAVDTVHKGTLPSDSQRRVYVEFTSAGQRPASFYDERAPRGQPILVYLVAAPAGSAAMNADDRTGGLPAGQPLWRAAGQVGLLIADEDGGVAQGSGDYYPDATLAALLPTAAEWPTASSPPES